MTSALWVYLGKGLRTELIFCAQLPTHGDLCPLSLLVCRRAHLGDHWGELSVSCLFSGSQ